MAAQRVRRKCQTAIAGVFQAARVAAGSKPSRVHGQTRQSPISRVGSGQRLGRCGRPRRLLVAEHGETGGQRGGQMIGRGVSSGGCQLRSPVRSGGLDDRAEEDQALVHVGDHEVSPGAENASELRVHRGQVVDVGQGQARDDQVGIGRRERERGELTAGEGHVGGARPGSRQHRRRAVHPDRLEAESGQLDGETPGTARGVDRPALRQLGDEGGDQRLVEIEQAVVLAVVGAGPLRVRALRRLVRSPAPGCEASSGSSSSERTAASRSRTKRSPKSSSPAQARSRARPSSPSR